MKTSTLKNLFVKLKPYLIAVGGLIALLFLYYLHLSSIDGNSLSIVAGDSGANAILIKKAKSFELFHGNYSRVGFFHPGPFFFQIQAFSEIIFTDYLNWINDIYLAQSSGIFLLNVFLLLIITYILSATTNSIRRGIWISLICIVLISLKRPYALSGMWMPQIYIMPYLAFISSFIGILISRIDNKKKNLAKIGIILALVSGLILVHGHASFVGLIPIQFVFSIILIEGLSYNGDQLTASPINLLKDLFARSFYFYRLIFSNKLFSISCVLVTSIFIAPFLLEAIIRFPGQFPYYFSFAGGSNGNSLPSSLIFIAKAWIGGPLLAIISIPAGIIVSQKLRNARSITLNTKILTIILAPAFLTTLFYTVKGIDNLKDVYIICYFTSVSGLYLSWIINTSLGSFGENTRIKSVFIVLISVMLAFAGINSIKLSPYIHRESAVQELYSYLQDGDRLSSINQRSKSGWIHFNGILAKNEVDINSKEICVADDSWFISFTKKYKCKESDSRIREVNFLDAREYDGVKIKLIKEQIISKDISFGGDVLSFELSEASKNMPPHTTLKPLQASKQIDRGKYLIFGNYFKIKKGSYSATLKYTCEHSERCGEFDFAVDKGKKIIFTVPLNESKDGIITKSFDINSRKGLFGELRVKYERGELKIHDISINQPIT